MQSVREQYRDSTNLQARIDLHARFSTATRDFHAWLFDHFDFSPRAHILEIGCGTGLLWSKNRERIAREWTLTLTDFSRGMIETARANVAAQFTQMDAQTLPFPTAYYDAVIANHMLYHVPDIPRAISEIRRVLKPRGKFYAATNGENHLRELFAFLEPLIVERPLHDGARFSLENGTAFLAAQFDRVERDDFVDALIVTEAEPMGAFLASTRLGKKYLDAATRARLRAQIQDRLAREGVIRITKSVGMFSAQ